MNNRLVIVIIVLILFAISVFFFTNNNRGVVNISDDLPKFDVVESCVRAGCSGELCVKASLASEIMTTCEFRPEYACYQEATCAVLDDGSCGFLQTLEFLECLETTE